MDFGGFDLHHELSLLETERLVHMDLLVTAARSAVERDDSAMNFVLVFIGCGMMFFTIVFLLDAIFGILDDPK